MGCHRYEGRGGIGMPMGAAYLREPTVKMMKDDWQRYCITATISIEYDPLKSRRLYGVGDDLMTSSKSFVAADCGQMAS